MIEFYIFAFVLLGIMFIFVILAIMERKLEYFLFAITGLLFSLMYIIWLGYSIVKIIPRDIGSTLNMIFSTLAFISSILLIIISKRK